MPPEHFLVFATMKTTCAWLHLIPNPNAHNPQSSAILDPSTARGDTRAQHLIPSLSGRSEPSLHPISCHNPPRDSREWKNTSAGSDLSIQTAPRPGSVAYLCTGRGSGCGPSPKRADLYSSSF